MFFTKAKKKKKKKVEDRASSLGFIASYLMLQKLGSGMTLEQANELKATRAREIPNDTLDAAIMKSIVSCVWDESLTAPQNAGEVTRMVGTINMNFTNLARERFTQAWM